MKTKVYTWIVVLLAWGGTGMAQITIEHESVQRKKRDIVVAFDVVSPAKSLKNNYKMVITPYLSNGADTVWLPPVAVYGKTRYKRERQEASLAGNKNWTLPERAIREGGEYAYSVAVPYRSWMKNASLAIDRKMVGCGCDCYDNTQELIGNVAIPPFIPNITPVEQLPEKYEISETHKRWEFDRELKVFFSVSKSTLDENLHDNQTTLEDIIEGIRKIEKADRLQLNEVEITGFASPEGGLKLNAQLGAKRAEALRDHIDSKVKNMDRSNFRLINGEENWEGLRRMVAESNIEYKDEVLNIIDQKEGNERKKALRTVGGGSVYAYILRNFYPELRNACYVAVYYDTLTDRVADAVDIAHKEIETGRYDEALKLLIPHAGDERTWNTIGVCYMMLDEEEKAIEWFEKAVGTGDEAARKNLEQLR